MSNLQSIRAWIAHLLDIFIQPEEFIPLRERVILAYDQLILNKLSAILNSEDLESEQILDLQACMTEIFELSKGNLTFITALPDADTTDLLCDIACFLNPGQPLSVLMPGVCIDAARDPYLTLEPKNKEQLLAVLKTHILGKNNLIPIKVLLELNSPKEKLKQPYLDMGVYYKEAEYYISQEEMKRLVSHSAETLAFINTLEEEEKLKADDDTLLGQLTRLLRSLKLNSVKGIGEEEAAGSFAYPAIIAFQEYLERLLPTQIQDIPPAVKAQIETLITLSSNPDQNRNATTGTTNIATCLATRSDCLTHAMSSEGVERALANIAVSEEKKQELIDQVIRNKEESRRTLDLLDPNQYSGIDRLPLTPNLLRKLGIVIHLRSATDVETLNGCTAEELRDVLKNFPDLKNEIIDIMQDQNNLLTFLIEMSPDRVRVLLQEIVQELLSHSTEIYRNLYAIAGILDPEKAKILYQEVLFAHRSGSIFSFGFEAIPHDQRIIAFEAIKDRLPEFINTAQDFISIFCSDYLSLKQHAEVFEIMKGRISELINNAKDFEVIFKHFSCEQWDVEFEVVKGQIPELIQNIRDFKVIFESLSFEQCDEVFEVVKRRIPELINNAEDFEAIFKHLTYRQRDVVFEDMKDRIPDLIRHDIDLEIIFNNLSHEQRAEIFSVVKNGIPHGFFTDLSNFRYMLNCFFYDQRLDMLIAVKDQIPVLAIEDFCSMFSYFYAEQYIDVLVILKNQIFVFTIEDLQNLCNELFYNQCAEVLIIVKDQIPGLINNLRDFNILLKLSPLLPDAVFDAIKRKIPELIHSVEDFKIIFAGLSREQRDEVFDSMKGQLALLINSVESLQKISCGFNAAQRSELLDIVSKAWIPSLIADKNISMDRFSVLIKISSLFLLDSGFPAYYHSLSDFKRRTFCIAGLSREDISAFAGLAQSSRFSFFGSQEQSPRLEVLTLLKKELNEYRAMDQSTDAALTKKCKIDLLIEINRCFDRNSSIWSLDNLLRSIQCSTGVVNLDDMRTRVLQGFRSRVRDLLERLGIHGSWSMGTDQALMW